MEERVFLQTEEASSGNDEDMEEATLNAQTSSLSFKAPGDNGSDQQDDDVDQFEGSRQVHQRSHGDSTENPLLFKFRKGTKKRKSNNPGFGELAGKRTKTVYNDGYRQLLNIDIHDTAVSTTLEIFDQLPQSQIGVTIWTSGEKEHFFAALARLGKDNVRGIATKIGSKSELQVLEYLQLLHQGTVERTQNEPRSQLLGFSDIPAAFEISPECCTVLESAGDALAHRQERHEELEERKRWGDSWLLDSEVNEWVERHLAKDSGDRHLKGVLPSAEFFHLRNWLELSARVFMNPGHPREQENWQSLTENDEEPAIRTTAFEDFHSLAITITRRLMSATVFCAMSRLRAMDSNSLNPYEIIKRIDVEAAAKIIGLKVNSIEYWIDCPRRCNLQVFQSQTAAFAGTKVIPYDDVEEALRNSDLSSRQSNQQPDRAMIDLRAAVESATPLNDTSHRFASCSTASEVTTESRDDSQIGVNRRDLASEYLTRGRLNYNGSMNPSDSEFEHPNKHQEQMLQKCRIQEENEHAQHEYAEAFDIHASLLEERQIWNTLSKEAPFAIKPENIELPDQPLQERKERAEVENWRNRVEYWSQWESEAPRSQPKLTTRPSRRTSTRRSLKAKGAVRGSELGESDKAEFTAKADADEEAVVEEASYLAATDGRSTWSQTKRSTI